MGGFLVFNPKILDMIFGNASSLEREVLEKLADRDELAAFCHDGFWQCVDTVRDLKYLEELWNTGDKSWKVLQ